MLLFIDPVTIGKRVVAVGDPSLVEDDPVIFAERTALDIFGLDVTHDFARVGNRHLIIPFAIIRPSHEVFDHAF